MPYIKNDNLRQELDNLDLRASAKGTPLQESLKSFFNTMARDVVDLNRTAMFSMYDPRRKAEEKCNTFDKFWVTALKVQEKGPEEARDRAASLIKLLRDYGQVATKLKSDPATFMEVAPTKAVKDLLCWFNDSHPDGLPGLTPEENEAFVSLMPGVFKDRELFTDVSEKKEEPVKEEPEKKEPEKKEPEEKEPEEKEPEKKEPEEKEPEKEEQKKVAPYTKINNLRQELDGLRPDNKPTPVQQKLVTCLSTMTQELIALSNQGVSLSKYDPRTKKPEERSTLDKLWAAMLNAKERAPDEYGKNVIGSGFNSFDRFLPLLKGSSYQKSEITRAIGLLNMVPGGDIKDFLCWFNEMAPNGLPGLTAEENNELTGLIPGLFKKRERVNDAPKKQKTAPKQPNAEEPELEEKWDEGPIEWEPNITPIRIAVSRNSATVAGFKRLFDNEGIENKWDVEPTRPGSATYNRSAEYNAMMQAAVDIAVNTKKSTKADLNRAKRACLDYIKGKEKVRFTQIGRDHFNFALRILHAVSDPNDPEVKAAVDKINQVRGVADKPNHKNFVKLDNYGVEPFGWEHEEELKQQLKDCAAQLKAKPTLAAAKQLQIEQQSCAMQLMVLRATTAPNQPADVKQIEELANKLVKNKKLTDFLNKNPDISKSASLQQQVVAGFIWSGGQLPTLLKGNQKELDAAVRENKQKIVVDPAGWSL